MQRLNRAFAVIATWTALSAHGQQQFTQIIFYPSSPTAGTPFQADVPAHQCFLSPGPPFGPTTVRVVGYTLLIDVTTFSGGSCFAAGDPLVLKPMRIDIGPLPQGDYQVQYTVSHYGGPPLQFNTTLSVLAAAAVPTMSIGGLLLLAGLLLLTSRNARRRRPVS